MLPAVEFDDEAMLDRSEIRHVGSDRDLAAKLDAGETAIAQQQPHRALDIRRGAPKRACGVLPRPHPASLRSATLSRFAGEGKSALTRLGALGDVSSLRKRAARPSAVPE